MEVQTALNVKKAIILLSEVTGIKFGDIAGSIGFFDNDGFEKLKEASVIWNDFESKNIVERGAMLGITVTEVEQ